MDKKHYSEVVRCAVSCAWKYAVVSDSSWHIGFSVSADAPDVSADSTQMHQILMNLATNAADAMRERGGVLEVGLEEGDGQCRPCQHIRRTPRRLLRPALDQRRRVWHEPGNHGARL